MELLNSPGLRGRLRDVAGHTRRHQLEAGDPTGTPRQQRRNPSCESTRPRFNHCKAGCPRLSGPSSRARSTRESPSGTSRVSVRVADQQATLAREGKDVEKRIARVVAAIETGGEAASLIAKLRELEARRQAINVEGASLQPVPRLEPAVIEGRLAEWRRLLRQSTTQGRTVLQRILRGRLTLTPRIDRHSGEMVGYNFEGPTRFDKLFAGIAGAGPRHVDRHDRFRH